MRCVLGFDGGGTKTECVLMDEFQQVLARTRSGPSNPLRVGFEATTSALREAARRAFLEARVEGRRVVAACAGLAGTRQTDAARKVHEGLTSIFPEAKICVLTDLALSLEATGQRPAIVLVAGTGSAAIGWDSEGRPSRAGGHGPLLGDQGSAYDIGRQAIVSALRSRDRTRADTLLGAQILEQLECPSWQELQNCARTAADEVFPRVFPVVAAAADAGNQVARGLLLDSARELVALVEVLVERLGLREVSFLLAKTGGMIGRSAFLDKELDDRLKQVAPHAEIGALPISPAEAGARVALSLISPRESAGN
jgi:N-acetylglucosamine kinase-like BadF-type ATPase